MRRIWIILLLTASLAHAEDKESWVGKEVLYTKPHNQITFGDRLKDDSMVTYEFSGRYPLKVRDEEAGWLRIHDGYQEGWVKKEDFILAIDGPIYFTQRIKDNANDEFAWQMRAEGWVAKGEYDNAIKDLTECIRLDPSAAAYYNNRGNAWDDKKEYDKAISDYNEAIKLDPKDASAHAALALAQHNLKNYDAAVTGYTHAIELNPKWGLLYAFRSSSYFKLKKYELAKKDHKYALKYEPDYWSHRIIAQFSPPVRMPSIAMVRRRLSMR